MTNAFASGMKFKLSITILIFTLTRREQSSVSKPNYNHYHPDLEVTPAIFPTSTKKPSTEQKLFKDDQIFEQAVNERTKQLVAWNCNLKNSLQYNEFSLLQVKDCDDISSEYKQPTEFMGQVVQAKRFEDMSVLSCRLKASFYVAMCSWSLISGYRQWSNIPKVTNIYLQLTRSECEHALKHERLEYTDRTYYAKHDYQYLNIKCQNRTFCTGSGWRTIRGESYPEKGSCLPDSFKLGRVYYGRHVLSMDYEIDIRWVDAVFNTARRIIKINDQLLLPNNSTGSFFSPTVGSFHWNKINQGNLSSHHWLEVIWGPVSLHEPTRPNQTMTIAYIYRNAGKDGLALSLLERTSLCHLHTCRTAYMTQISDVYLVLYQKMGQTKWKLNEVRGSQVDRIANLEVKITSIHLNQELKLKNSFESVSKQLCQRSREIILSNIQGYINNVLKQDENNDSRGRYFIKSGSVTYSVKCAEQIAWLRADTTECYEDAPIYYTDSQNNKISAFLDPVSYIIKPSSPLTKCNDVLPFKLNFMAIDGTSEWICRTSLGWNVDCRAPTVIHPMQPRALYTLKDQTLRSSLYSKDQIKSLDDLQWDKTVQSVDLNEWENYLKRLREDNPRMPAPTYFENLHSTVEEFSQIFSEAFWAKLVLKHLMPIIILNYFFNVALNMIKAVLHIRQVYLTAGFSLSLVARTIICLIAACFPVFALSLLQTSQTEHPKCRCEKPGFLDEVTKAVSEKERQVFLKNLQL